jgi:hypothetical protein
VLVYLRIWVARKPLPIVAWMLGGTTDNVSSGENRMSLSSTPCSHSGGICDRAADSRRRAMKQHAVRAGKRAEVMVLSTLVLANHGCGGGEEVEMMQKSGHEQQDAVTSAAAAAELRRPRKQTMKQTKMHTHRHVT